MDWITVEDAAKLWSYNRKTMTEEQVKILCDRGLVSGAIKKGDTWVIPKGTKRPDVKEKMKSFVKDLIKKYGHNYTFKSEDIITKYEQIYDEKFPDSGPRDYCYNFVNKGALNDKNKPYFFEYRLEEDDYKVLGAGKSFDGEIYAKPRNAFYGNEEKKNKPIIVVGYCKNGRRNDGITNEKYLKYLREEHANKPTKQKQQSSAKHKKSDKTHDPIKPVSSETISPTKSAKKPKNENPEKSKQPHEISLTIKDIIIQINKTCTYFNKLPIFNESGTLEIWRKIETTCNTENDFIIFALDLYKLLYETTRSENPNFNKHRDKSKDFYLYRLPDEFMKNGNPTKDFMDIIGTLRHKYAHKEPEYKVNITKLSFADILEKLNVNKLPTVDFKKLQVEVLLLFEIAMNDLIKILEKELNSSRNP